MQKLIPTNKLTTCYPQENHLDETYEYVEFESTPIAPNSEYAKISNEPTTLTNFADIQVNEPQIEPSAAKCQQRPEAYLTIKGACFETYPQEEFDTITIEVIECVYHREQDVEKSSRPATLVAERLYTGYIYDEETD